ncbi:lipocalin-like domain-containing protein [Labrenzia sp. PHM005]|uniref:lipocalin-like domain-containing protein n=1 Tax=Labrenzia sp. PHM005 TaxID=2590016 RepID=UPI0011402373|nr:lipocalin-like domain-containing protein [Labrenzia sp. PHM005]QDG78849.1 lipocalin-like domain-containing protein [Labrenzia sp. PHM005]
MTNPSSFTGTWQLNKWTALKNNTPAGYPMGEDAQGQIIYSADGHMCAFLMRSDFKNQAELGDADTCLSYAGSWSFDGTRISHDVHFCNLPHWVGRTLVRIVNHREGELALRTVPEYSKSGSKYEHLLVWQKASD